MEVLFPLLVLTLLVLAPCGEAAAKKAREREEYDVVDDGSSLILEIQHAFSAGNYGSRGVVSIRGLKPGANKVTFAQESLSHQQLEDLQESAVTHGAYFIRAKTTVKDPHSEVEEEEDGGYVSTFISACSLVSSRLSDIITISGDGKGNVIGLSITTPVLDGSSHGSIDCSTPAASLPHHFNTSIYLDNGTPGPIPDAQGHLAKLEQEEQKKREGKDERSFFQKYWMYIIGGVALMMLLSGSGGGGGGGG